MSICSRLIALVLTAMVVLPAWAQTAPTSVDVELVMLADTSGSIDAGELALQRGGAAAALVDPEVLAAGITINGLAVVCRACNGPAGGRDIIGGFERSIIGGPGAFVIAADVEQSIAEAIRRKLLLEIVGDASAPRVAWVD